MTVSTIGRDPRARFAVAMVLALAAAALCACGSKGNNGGYGGATGTGSGGGSATSSSSSGSGGLGNGIIPGADGGSGGICLTCTKDASVAPPDAGTVTSSSGGGPFIPTPAMGSVPAPDCAGCSFPAANAPPCASSAPAIKIVYPNDNVLLPPNMNVISVHWTPFGPPFSKYSVDFSAAPLVDWHIVTKCTNQTIDAQSGAPSGGCEVLLDPVSWSKLVAAGRGQGPITITVRGTTDGTCASSSMNQIHLSFAEEDLLGTYYYWKSTVSPNGTGGQIWKKTFGDLSRPEVDVTTPAIPAATCNGCHSLSRDGTRMVVYSDDDDSDDEYDDVAGSYLDMTTNPATEFPGGVTGIRQGGQPPGFSTIDPAVTVATTPTAQGFYITSNGFPCTVAGGCGGTSNPYPAVVPSNGWSTWNGTNGAFIGSATIGGATTRPTMPDWSPDGKTIVYVVPAGTFNTWRMDDAHIYGGSIYTVPYTGNGTFGAPAVFVQSAGENNYYPSYSPDVPMSFVIFDRVDNMKAGAACAGGFCLDDSFSNPAARLMLIGAAAAGSTPVDLEKANGSPLTGKVPWSNSYPRWAPFVQSYRGNKLLWFTFSSTRDYGVRVLNHKTGMYQCYPSDSAESPGSPHHGVFAAQCQEPQLWMAPLFFAEASQGKKDPSGPAFWIPYQDIGTHNHTAQWTQQHLPPPMMPNMPPPVCKCQANIYGACGTANGGCPCCANMGFVCSGSNTCVQIAN